MSNGPLSREFALFQAVYTLAYRAGFPVHFLSKVACKWARTWRPSVPLVCGLESLTTQVDYVIKLLVSLKPKRSLVRN